MQYPVTRAVGVLNAGFGFGCAGALVASRNPRPQRRREAGTLEMPKSVGHERPYGKPLVCTKKLKYAKIAQNSK